MSEADRTVLVIGATGMIGGYFINYAKGLHGWKPWECRGENLLKIPRLIG